MKSFVDTCRYVVNEREGDFLTTVLGNPALYVIPNSDMATALVDAFAAQNPQAFVKAVGLWMYESAEVD